MTPGEKNSWKVEHGEERKDSLPLLTVGPEKWSSPSFCWKTAQQLGFRNKWRGFPSFLHPLFLWSNSLTLVSVSSSIDFVGQCLFPTHPLGSCTSHSIPSLSMSGVTNVRSRTDHCRVTSQIHLYTDIDVGANKKNDCTCKMITQLFFGYLFNLI